MSAVWQSGLKMGDLTSDHGLHLKISKQKVASNSIEAQCFDVDSPLRKKRGPRPQGYLPQFLISIQSRLVAKYTLNPFQEARVDLFGNLGRLHVLVDLFWTTRTCDHCAYIGILQAPR